MRCQAFCRLSFASLALAGLCLTAQGELLEADVLATCTSSAIEVDTREEHDAYAALGGEGVEVVGDTDITGDVTWTADKVWLVTGIVLVKGGMLTIEPGTKVLLGVGSGIRQDGGLVVSDGVAFAPMSDEQVRAFAMAVGIEVDTREEHVAYAALGGEGVEVVGDMDITGDVTWTADKTWLVTGIVLVKGGTLTIEPGTKVLLGVGSGIRQDGGVVVADGVAFAPMSDEDVRVFATAAGTEVDTREEHVAYAALGGEGVEVVGDTDITGDVTWTADKTWLVTGIVLVKGGTLTIESGAKVLLGVGSGIRQDGGVFVSDGVAFAPMSDEQVRAFALAAGIEVDTREEHVAYAALGGEGVEVVGDTDITGDVTWTADKVWLVTGIVLVKGGMLTIEPGTKVLLGVGSGIRQDGGLVVSDGVAFAPMSDEQVRALASGQTDIDTRTDITHYVAAGTEVELYGEPTWTAPNEAKLYTLSHTDEFGDWTAEYKVVGDNVVVVGDTGILADATWTSDKTWIVAGTVLVQGGTLTIEPGTTVLLGVGSGIRQDGGTVVADGVAFSNIAFDGRMDYAEAEKGDVRMDTDVGHLRVAATEEPIAFSTAWGTSAAAQVKVSYATAYGENADVVSEAGPTEGEYVWRAEKPGYYSFSHVAGDEMLTAEFVVPDFNETELVSNGEISESTDWSKDKVILINGILTVKSGAVLTIAPGAIVKFMDGAGIVCEAGGRCVAGGVIFTHVNDDTVGGDTLLDGSTAPLTDMYVLNGVSGNDATQYRYHPDPTVTLSGTISKNEVWRGFNVYCVTGNVAVASGVTLTVEPGAIIKFADGKSLTVNSGATLNAIGTRAEPIVFTSIKDDDYGGDTNKDGDKTWPYPGDWGCVLISGGTIHAAYCRFTYGSGVDGNQYGARACVFMWNGGSGTFDGCLFGGSIMDGCFAQNATFRNCIFTDCDRGLVSHSGTITAINCVATYNRIGFFSHTSPLIVRNSISSLNLESAITGDGGSRETFNCYFEDDPKFIDAENGDFRIAEGSPCIDAADAAYAPETDYFGQPRINAPDIGLCEYIPRGTTSDIDLVPQSVTTDAEAISGQLLTINWEVANKGGTDVDDSWHDTVSLVSANGREVVLGEKVITKRLVAGGAISCSAVFTVPAIAEGAWYPKVNVNSSRDIFEGALGDNNALTGETAVNVSINSIAVSDSAPKVVPSSSSAIYRIDGLPSGGGVLVFSGDLASLTFAGVTDANVLVSGTSMVGVSLPDGRMILPFASGTDMQYLTVANRSDHTAEFTVAVVEDSLQILSLSQMSVSNRGKTTIDIYGIGLSNVTSVVLSGNGHRYSATSFDIKSATEMYANFDANGWEAGTYSLVVEKDGVSSQIDNVVLFQNGIGPKVTVSIEKPDAVRMGRWYTATITCTNEGDEDAHVPMVMVIGSSETFLDPDNGVDEYKGSIRLLFLSHTGNPLVMKAGQSITVPLQFKSMASDSAFVLALQCHVPGLDKILWDSFIVSDATTMEALKHRFGEAPDLLVEAAFREAVECAKFGVVPYCADSFILANMRRCVGIDVKLLCTALGCSDLEHMEREVTCVSKSDKSVKRGLFNNDGKAFFLVSGQDWVFLSKSGTGTYRIKNVSTNQNPYRVEIDYLSTSRIDDEAIIPDLRHVAKMYGFCHVVTIDRNSRIVGWIDDAGRFLLGKQMNSEIQVIDTEQLDEGVYSDFRVQSNLGGSPFLVLHGEKNEQSVILKKEFDIDNGELRCLGKTICLLDSKISCPVLLKDGSVSYIDDMGRVVTVTNLVFRDEMRVSPQLQRRRLSAVSFPAPASISIGKAPWCEFQGEANVVNNTSHMDACCKWSNYQELSASGSATILGATFSPEIKVSAESVAGCDGVNCSEPAEILYSHMYGGGSLPIGYTPGKYMDFGDAVVELLCQGLNHIEAAGDAVAQEAFELLETFMGKGTLAYLRKKVKAKGDTSVTGGIFIDFDQYYEGDKLVRDEVKGGFRLNGTVSYYIVSGMVRGRALTLEMNLDAGYSNLDGLYSDGSASIRIGNYVNLECGIKSTLFGNIEPYGGWRVTVLGGGNYSDSLDELPIGQTLDGKSYRSENGTVSPNLSLDILNAGNGEKDEKIWIAPVPLDSGHLDSRLEILSHDLDGTATHNVLPITGVAGYASVGNEIVVSARSNSNSGDTQALYGFNFSDGILQQTFIIDDIDDAIIRGIVQTTSGTVTVMEKVNDSGNDVIIVNNEDGVWKHRVIESNVDGTIASVSCSDGDCLVVDILRTNEQGNDYIHQLSIEKAKVTSCDLSVSNRANVEPIMSTPNQFALGDSNLPKLLSANLKRSILSQSNISRDDGCDIDCYCDCRFHFPCGCPQTCPCQGHCSETDECCDCKDKYGVQIHKSKDPNEMSGPLGLGNPETERFVKPSEWLTYTIYFENVSNATAAAQEVYVTNPLSEWLDWSTFEMGEVAFGNQIDLGLSGKNGGTCETTMKGTNFVVRTALELVENGDAGTRDACPYQAKWYLRIVDPTTDTGWPKDILAGFLPPNDETFRGEGHLTYRIKVRDDAPAGIVITNKASIVFDYNDPIETDPAWWNTVGQIKDIQFDDGAGGSATQNLIVGVPYGEKLTAAPEKGKSGYTFAGWFTGPNGTGRHITAESLVEEGDNGLYADWTANTYFIAYSANGGEGEMPIQTNTYDVVSCLASNAFTCVGYRFAGWATNETSAPIYADGAAVSNLTSVADEMVNLYAVWGDWQVSFVEAEIDADEGSNVVVKVNGGNIEKASSVQLYLTYNTAAAADLDLAKGTIGGETPKGGLKFPLTLSWAKGEIGEKVITIPVKTDKTVEDDEFFTLQLANAQGMELGEERVCTVTIRDLNDKTLKAAVTPYKPKKNEEVTTNSVGVTVSADSALASGTVGGFVAGTGDYTSGSKLTLTAEARPGWSFAGWRLKDGDGTILSDKTKWQIAVTNDAEYEAVFEKIPYVRGLADPADGGKVSGSGLCDKDKKVTLKATANKNFTFLGWRQGTGNGELGTGNGFVATTASLVIDRTAKPTANSKTSTTLTNVAEDVTYYAVFKSDPEIFVTVDATDVAGAEPTGKGAGKYVAGTITGMGKYAPGKKVTLKATANKGYVFAGWLDANGDPLTKDATYTIASMGESDVEYTAQFVTTDEDKASIELAVAMGAEAEAFGLSTNEIVSITNFCGVAMNWQLAADALSQTTVKVAGLPSGLKFTAKDILKKGSKTEVEIPANTIYGAPTAASKTDKNGNVTPSKVVFTVTTAGKSTQTFAINLYIDPLPDWAVGTFDGATYVGDSADASGLVQAFTVAANGKISGKLLRDDGTWTLAASAFDSVRRVADNAPYQGGATDEAIAFVATVVGKSGKLLETNEVTVSATQVELPGGYGLRGVANGNSLPSSLFPLPTSLSWKACQNLWKRADTKEAMPVFKTDRKVDHWLGGQDDVSNMVTLTFKKEGVVSFAGKADGVKVSGSSQLVWDDSDLGGTAQPGWRVTLYAPPKGAFAGFRKTLAVTLTADDANIVTAVTVE